MSLTWCPDCLQQFTTSRGLSNYRCSAHPEEYHLEDVLKERKKARWDHEDRALLAHQEIDLLAAGGRVNVNKCLAETFPNRILEAIKGVRRRPAYKELMKNLFFNRMFFTKGINFLYRPCILGVVHILFLCVLNKRN